MLRKLRFTAVFLVISFAVVYGQDSPVRGVGNIHDAAIGSNKVDITTDNAFVSVTVYRPDIIRVRMDKHKLQRDFSYAVIAAPDEQAKATITQDNTAITITTDSLKAVIHKTPFSIAFYTPQGVLINEDEKGLTTSWIGEEVTTYKKMQDGERFIGLGEKTGNLDRRGNGYTNWNTDAFGYSANQDPIYSTIPFYIGIHHNVQYGIFMDNTYQSDFNFGASNDRFSSFGARGGEMNYYFIYNSSVAGLIKTYTHLTGRMKMPPLWSLGYQQNRYSYYPEAEVLRIAQTLREKKIPSDGITLDIHYMDAYKLFTWNKERFPNPKGLTDKLNAMGFKTTVIVDPGIKKESGYGVYERGIKDDIFIKYSDGQYYTGQVWPGWCHFPDFTREKARNWWKNEIKTYAGAGVAGIWNDMNEIATWGQKMPNNVLFDFDGKTTTHQEAHNVFGMQMARSSFEGYKQALNGKRPFVLTRAGYAGLQRYSAIWTGDNRSEDDHMLAGVRLLNSLGVSGVPFTGMDIGGFTGGPSVNLFIRWMQIGAFIPYYRNHTAVNTPSSEPWTHGEEALEITRNFVNLRYKMLPYLYSHFYEATKNGMPVNRTLAIEYAHDDKIYDGNYQNQYLFGKSLMVLPVAGNAGFCKAYFPKGKWYNFYTGELQDGNSEKILPLEINKLPLYARGGGIITMQSLIQSTSEKPGDTMTVYVYKGDEPNKFTYYEDDGETYNYENGSYYKRTITFDPAAKTITFGDAEGSLTSKFKVLKVVFTGFGNMSGAKVNDHGAEVKDELLSFLTPVSRFDPQGASNPVEGYHAAVITVKNDNSKIVFGF
ncbi:glycoside hydrolase family 31 protein [Chitinophagaceae bacterium MMS25-I14]